MSAFTAEQLAELENVRQLNAAMGADPGPVGLRVWSLAWSNAVMRYAAGDPPINPPQQLEDVLDAFASVGRPVANLVENPRRLAPDAFHLLMDAAQALELKAASACQALPPHEKRTPEEQAAHEVCLMAQGLPFQLCVYAKDAGGMLQ